MRRANLDPNASVRVVGRRALRFEPDVAQRVGTGWVRSGSALARFGERVMLIQDDARWLTWLDAEGRLDALPLPSDAWGARLSHDKRRKPDFEAAVVVPGEPARLLVFGSGALPAREGVVLLEAGGAPRVIQASSLYGALRRDERFVGAELNLEGALVDGGQLLLCSRGNGAPSAAGERFDATVELDLAEVLAYLDAGASSAAPRLGRVERYCLGSVDGVTLTLTDASVRDGRRYYLAAAEASADAIADGPVLGASFGLLTEQPRYALIESEDGSPLRDKVEGICPAASDDEWLAIVDADDPTRPADLLTLRSYGL
ncbi:MAG TPA: hypothetical protein VIW29_23450 [Polyangiaceae bacterium]